ncbi:MAG: glycosyltransferase family 4 protein [Planctomycetota bacterium]
MRSLALDYRPALYSRGGIARSVRELARAMTRIANARGLMLHLFGHGLKRGYVAGEPVPAPLHRMRLPGRALPALALLGLDAARLAGDADLFHWTDYVYPPVRRGKERPRVVQTVHDLAFMADARFHGKLGSRRLRKRIARALARADLLVCPSEATARDVQRYFPDHPPLRVVPFGVDHVERFRSDPERGRRLAAERLRTSAPYLIALATLEPRKNHCALIEALCILEERGRSVPLLCVGGRGWENEQLFARLSSSELPFPCAFTGCIEDAEMFDLLAGAMALVYPSSLEGFGFPPMEALELGVPAIVGDCAAIREQLGDAGLYVNGSDPASIASGIDGLLAEPDSSEQHLRAWHARRARFRWQRSAESHLEIYESLIGGGGT